MRRDYFGTGFAFPPRVDPDAGQLALVGDTEIVAQALRMLLRTSPGERLMRPDYGCALRRYLFAPNTVATRRMIAEEVARSVSRFEDRVDLTGVDVVADAGDPAQLDVTIRYTLRRTGAAAALTDTFRLDGQRS